MTPVLIELLLGLFFIVNNVPEALGSNPENKSALVKFLLGVALFALAFFHISLVR